MNNKILNKMDENIIEAILKSRLSHLEWLSKKFLTASTPFAKKFWFSEYKDYLDKLYFRIIKLKKIV
jgi:hypothetical protein